MEKDEWNGDEELRTAAVVNLPWVTNLEPVPISMEASRVLIGQPVAGTEGGAPNRSNMGTLEQREPEGYAWVVRVLPVGINSTMS